ncbi:MAG TPA: MmcQ/YjbR family DNA-binding protein [Burkholderiaceae bacterium]|jgi:uncharacterized protein YdhG (YjbR/CyaY superfamily)|nr:MmcQ/YjbR family DNA-binding protein [Burkholderiaceae bacterium]
MAVSLDSVRTFALSLPDTTEEPHHDFGSFRVRGKIFVTIPPGEALLHIFLPEHERELALAAHPDSLEPVHWGAKVLGVRARLALTSAAVVTQLVRTAYDFKAASVPVRRPGPGPDTIDAYIDGFPPRVQTILQSVRATVRTAAPLAEETISYRIPAFKYRGVLVYFAAFHHHIGFYPPVSGDPALEAAVAPYAGEKGNLRFPLDEPMPLALIERITRLRVAQNEAKALAKRRAKKVR